MDVFKILKYISIIKEKHRIHINYTFRLTYDGFEKIG
jgi:hypothetical protein